jgi:glycosyltransferase involved in cell wall biosynthesis
VVDNGVDVDHFTFEPRSPASPPEVVYVGSLGYAPNGAAAVRLLDGIMPRVWQRRPDARLTIVGQGPDPALLARDDGARVRVVGRVADVRPYLARAHALCVPLRVGSGTKLKVLEALSAGVPVVCTPVAAEGLDLAADEHLLVRETDADLARAMLDVIDDRALADRLARAGRARVAARYAWDANLAPLAGWLEALRRAPAR